MIYIQSNNDKTLAHHFDASCALYGAIMTGQDYKLVTYDDVLSGKFDLLIKKNLFVGSVEFMREVFNRIGLTPRVIINSDREEEKIKLSEAIERINNGEKIFVKPYKIKLFTGMVFDKRWVDMLYKFDSDETVIVSKPFDSEIKSEWRTYIKNGIIVDIKNYLGDLFTQPNESYIKSVINKYSDILPCSYTVDIGVLENGENVVIEFNDMWAIGNYGVPNDDYLSMLGLRYFEIIRNGK
jgi:hypothetical protein